jgi:hypothetical protein
MAIIFLLVWGGKWQEKKDGTWFYEPIITKKKSLVLKTTD